MGQKLKTLVYLEMIVSEIKKEAKSPSELERAIKVSHKQLYRIIDCLENIGVVGKGDDGKYGWVEDWQVFLDEKGYRQKLSHSRELLRPLIGGLEQPSRISISEEQVLTNKFLIQHLQSRNGYPVIHTEYEDWQRIEEACKKAREAFKEAVREDAAKNGFEIVEYGKLEAGKKQVSNIYEDVEGYLRYGGLENMKIVWKDGQVQDDYRGLALAKEEEPVGEVEKLLCDLIGSENVKKAFEEMEKAAKQRDEAYFKYRKDVEWLALKAKHGEPLKGYCDLCPRIVIKHI
jgi:hypothetical protein